MPPASSALDLYFAPKRLPIHTPAAENKNVVRPMTGTEGTSGTCRKANVTPTASASIESAIASGNMTFGENDASNFFNLAHGLADHVDADEQKQRKRQPVVDALMAS